MSYPGGKGLVYQRLINQIPPHETYIESHLGGGAIMRHKRSGGRSVGIDPDETVIASFRDFAIKNKRADIELGKGRAEIWLFSIGDIGPNDFIFCDPPYLPSTRKGGPLYRYEYTEYDHRNLLDILKRLKCMIMITGYRHAMYDDTLGDWRRIDYQAMTRQGLVWESAWMNYPEPAKLHDYRYLGVDFRERERIQRKAKRWVNKLEAMPILEQQALLAAMNNAINP